MQYRNRTKRCPHGFATFIRCETCEGVWKHAKHPDAQRVEPKRWDRGFSPKYVTRGRVHT